jgi:hypothetical protein
MCLIFKFYLGDKGSAGPGIHVGSLCEKDVCIVRFRLRSKQCAT